MWVSLRVGLPDTETGPVGFQGSQVYSARTASLKRAGGFFAAFFSDPANVNANRDGHYQGAPHAPWARAD